MCSLLSILRDLYELLRVADEEARKEVARTKRKKTTSGPTVMTFEGDQEEESTKSILLASSHERKQLPQSRVTDSSNLFRPSLQGTTIKDLDWTRFVLFLWRYHFPLCLDALKTGVDLLTPLKNLGIVKGPNQGLSLACGLTSSVIGLATAWNPIYRLSP